MKRLKAEKYKAAIRKDPRVQAAAKAKGLALEVHLDNIVKGMKDETLAKMENCPPAAWMERVMYEALMGMTPPPNSGEPEVAEAFFKVVRSTLPADGGQELSTAAAMSVRDRWLQNYTLLDKEW